MTELNLLDDDVTELDIVNEEVIELKVEGSTSVVGRAEWGEITGNIQDQTDLKEVLDLKADTSSLNWDSLENKPFNTIDNNSLSINNLVLKVNTTDDAEEDNTKPITSSGVNTIVGNINVLLEQI